MPTRTQRRAEQRRTAELIRKGAAPLKNAPSAAQAMGQTLERPSASEAQIAANRENAQKSTGPTSEIGRAAISQNRRVHGLNYNAATFTVLPCENQADYDQLLLSLNEEHNPETTTESLLVTSMAQHRWLLDRATRLQETCFDPATAQITDQKLLSLYLRYATSHERAFHKCLNDLLKLRKQEETKQIGFESQTRRQERHYSAMWLNELEGLQRQGKFLDGITPENMKLFIELAGLSVKKAA